MDQFVQWQSIYYLNQEVNECEMIESTVATADSKFDTGQTMMSYNLTSVRRERVELYPVVMSLTSLIVLITVGGVINVIVIAAMTWRHKCIEILGGCSRGVFIPLFRQDDRVLRIRDRGIPNLCAGALILCFVSAPLEFTTVYKNYVGSAAPPLACIFAGSTFHLALCLIVCCLVMLVVAECADINNAATSSSESKRKVCVSNIYIYLKYQLLWKLCITCLMWLR